MYVKALVPSMIMFLYVSFKNVSSDIIDSYLIDGIGWFRLMYCEYTIPRRKRYIRKQVNRR